MDRFSDTQIFFGAKNLPSILLKSVDEISDNFYSIFSSRMVYNDWSKKRTYISLTSPKVSNIYGLCHTNSLAKKPQLQKYPLPECSRLLLFDLQLVKIASLPTNLFWLLQNYRNRYVFYLVLPHVYSSFVTWFNG